MVLWAFLTGRNIDWGNFVRFQMILAKKDNEALPYTYFITCVLEHFNVPLNGETVEKSKRSHAIGATTLARMGFHKRQNQWVLSKSHRQQEQQERTPSPTHPSASTPPPAYVTDILTRMQDLKVFVGQRLMVLVNSSLCGLILLANRLIILDVVWTA